MQLPDVPMSVCRQTTIASRIKCGQLPLEEPTGCSPAACALAGVPLP